MSRRRRDSDSTYIPSTKHFHSRESRKKRDNYLLREREISVETEDDIELVERLDELETTVVEIKPEMANEDAMTKMMQLILEDRQKDREYREKRDKLAKEEMERREKIEKQTRDAHEKLLLQLMEKQSKQATEARQTSRIDRGLSKIQPLREGDDVEDFINSLEAHFQQEDIPAKYWKTALLTAIPPKVKALVRETILVDDCEYRHVVNTLLDCAGLTPMKAADMFLDNSKLKGKYTSPAEPVYKIFKWLEKTCQGAQTVENAIAKLAIAKVRNRMTVLARQFFTTRGPTTKKELLDVLYEWSVTNGSLESAFKREGKCQPTTQKAQVTCFFCRKQGHRMADCWLKNRQQQTHQHQPQMQSPTTAKEERDMKPVVCFNCREVGHKANACLKPRQTGSRKRTEEIKKLETNTTEWRQLGQN